MASYATSRADLVLIPTQGSHLDAAESAKAIKLVRSQEKAFGRTIPFAILFTRTSVAIRTKTFQAIEDEFASKNIPMLKSHIHEREAYRAIFSFGGTLQTLGEGDVSNIRGAIINAHAYVSEVVALLKKHPHKTETGRLMGKSRASVFSDAEEGPSTSAASLPSPPKDCRCRHRSR